MKIMATAVMVERVPIAILRDGRAGGVIQDEACRMEKGGSISRWVEQVEQAGVL